MDAKAGKVTIDREEGEIFVQGVSDREPPKSQGPIQSVSQCSSPPKRQLCPHPSDLVCDSDGEKEATKKREKELRRLGT